MDGVSPLIPFFWRRASTFCKAPLKKSRSAVFSASTRLSWLTSLRSVNSPAPVHLPGRIDRATRIRTTDASPVLSPAPRCSRNVAVARPPCEGIQSDSVSFVSFQLAVPFPAKGSLFECQCSPCFLRSPSGFATQPLQKTPPAQLSIVRI
jgi:hypothetical protein